MSFETQTQNGQNSNQQEHVARVLNVPKPPEPEPGVGADNSEKNPDQENPNPGESATEKGSNFWEKAKTLLSNKQIQKKFAASMLGSVASIAGVKAIYDLPMYLRQRFSVRGGLGSKGMQGSLEELIDATWNADFKKKNADARVGSMEAFVDDYGNFDQKAYQQHDFEGLKNKKDGEVRIAIRDLNKRLEMTKEGEQRGSEQRKKIAEILLANRRERREASQIVKDQSGQELLDAVMLSDDPAMINVAEEYKFKREINLEHARAQMTDILDKHTTTKITGLQATRESLNSICVATGSMALRPVGYGVMDALERYQKMKKDGKIEGGTVAEQMKEFWQKVIVDAIRETRDEALLRDVPVDEKDKKRTGLKKGLDFVKAWGKIARYAGFGVTTAFHPEKLHHSVDAMIDLFDSKEKFAAGVGHNFQGNLERVAHVSLKGSDGKGFMGLNHDNVLFKEQPNKDYFLGVNHDNAIFKEDFKGLNHDNVIFKEDFKGLNHDNAIFGKNHELADEILPHETRPPQAPKGFMGINQDNAIFADEKPKVSEHAAGHVNGKEIHPHPHSHKEIDHKVSEHKTEIKTAEKIVTVQKEIRDVRPTIEIEHSGANLDEYDEKMKVFEMQNRQYQENLTLLEVKRGNIAQEIEKLQGSESPFNKMTAAQNQLDNVRAQMRPILDAQMRGQIDDAHYQEEFVEKIGPLQAKERSLLADIDKLQKETDESYGKLDNLKQQLDGVNGEIENLKTHAPEMPTLGETNAGSTSVEQVASRGEHSSLDQFEGGAPQRPVGDPGVPADYVPNQRPALTAEEVEAMAKTSPRSGSFESVTAQQTPRGAETISGYEQSDGRLDRVTKLESASVVFKYDYKGDIVGSKIDANYFTKGAKPDFKLPDADKILFDARVRDLPRIHLDNVNDSVGRNLLIYAELNKTGHKKEAEYILRAIYNTIAIEEKRLGMQIFDRSKLPKL